MRQRTQAINALRGHLTEYGLVVAKGPSHVTRLVEKVEDPTTGPPEAARLVLRVLIASLQFLSERIALLDREITCRAREDNEIQRLTTIPGVGPVTATALVPLTRISQGVGASGLRIGESSSATKTYDEAEELPMPTECSADLFGFAPVEGRQVVAEF